MSEDHSEMKKEADIDSARVHAEIGNILELIDQALDVPSDRLKKEVDIIENRLVGLRNRLIFALRRREGRPAVLSPALDTVNTALSLAVSIEYPGAGLHRDALTAARDLLGAFPGGGEHEE